MIYLESKGELSGFSMRFTNVRICVLGLTTGIRNTLNSKPFTL